MATTTLEHPNDEQTRLTNRRFYWAIGAIVAALMIAFAVRTNRDGTEVNPRVEPTMSSPAVIAPSVGTPAEGPANSSSKDPQTTEMGTVNDSSVAPNRR